MTKQEVLSSIEKAEKRFDAAGSRSFFARNVLRAFWLREKYIKYILLRLFPSLRARVKEITGKTAWGRTFLAPASDVYGISLACFGLLTGPDICVAKYLAKKIKETDVFCHMDKHSLSLWESAICVRTLPELLDGVQ